MKLLLLLIGLVPACQSNAESQPTYSDSEIRASLPFTANDKQFVGTGVLQRSSATKFVLTLPEKTARIYVTSCHREEVFQKPASRFEYRYVPAMFLENWDSCLLVFSAITQQGNLLHAIADWTSNETLPAKHNCNGQYLDSASGASFCQSRTGLIQRITFDSKVTAFASDGCPEPVQDGYSFTYEIAEKFCIYLFADKDKRKHRLTTRGYSRVEME